MKFKRGESNLEFINMNLVRRQNIEVEDVKKIDQLQTLRRYIFDIIDDLDDVERIKELSEFLTELEFKLQGLWGFPKNADYHRWWVIPKCSCPKLDNDDNIGTPWKIYDDNCIIHGS